MTTGSEEVRDLRNQTVGGGLGFFNLPRPDPTFPRVPDAPRVGSGDDQRLLNIGFHQGELQRPSNTPPPRVPYTYGPGFYPIGWEPPESLFGFGQEDALREYESEIRDAQFQSQVYGVSIEDAIGLSGLDKSTRDALLGLGSGGGGGSSTPLWRPGELDLMLKRFGLDVEGFEEAKRQFELDFGLREDQFGLSERTLGEAIRANKAREADADRGRGLEAASSALQAYLNASNAKDARKSGVLSALPSLLPSLVDPNQEFFAGMEPGGLLARAAAKFGLGDIGPGPKIQHVPFDVGEFVRENPEQAAIRKELIDAILNIGGISRSAAQSESTAQTQDQATAAATATGGTIFPGGSQVQQ